MKYAIPFVKHAIFSKMPGITATIFTDPDSAPIPDENETGKWLFTFPSSFQNSASYSTLSPDSSEEPFVKVASNIKNQLTSSVQIIFENHKRFLIPNCFFKHKRANIKVNSRCGIIVTPFSCEAKSINNAKIGFIPSLRKSSIITKGLKFFK